MYTAVDLPSEPLASEGPALQHLGKTRPKPARMQRGGRSRPTIKPSSVPDESELANTNQEQVTLSQVYNGSI